MEGLSQELIAIIAATITLAALIVPGTRALRHEIGELRREVGDLDRRLVAEVDGLRAELQVGLAKSRAELRAELQTGLAESRAELRAELQTGLGELRAEVSGLRADIGEVGNQVSELRERMARVEGLLEGFTRSEPAFGTGPAG